MWISPEFKIYLAKEFRRPKEDENDRLKLGGNLQRTLTKINSRIHTDAIKETLIPPSITKTQTALVYANEADLLNVALFGQTAKQWRDTHPDAEGNEHQVWFREASRRDLHPDLRADYVLANGSMPSNQSGDCPARSAMKTPKAKPQSLPRQRVIRRALIEADLVDSMVALPGQLFYITLLSTPDRNVRFSPR